MQKIFFFSALALLVCSLAMWGGLIGKSSDIFELALAGFFLLLTAGLCAMALFVIFRIITLAGRAARPKPYSDKPFWLALAAGVAGVALNMLLCSCMNVREPARLMANRNNLRHLYFSVEDYSMVHDGMFPPIGAENQQDAHTPNEDGVYPHSWRVYILPYMEETALFEQIRLNEPWDSEWNRQFHDKMPMMFRNPVITTRDDTESSGGKTSFCMIVGKEAGLIRGGKPISFEKMAKANGDKILIAESELDCWMNPTHDIVLSDAVRNQVNRPGGIWYYSQEKTAQCVRCDGSGYSFLFKTDPEQEMADLKKRLTYSLPQEK